MVLNEMKIYSVCRDIYASCEELEWPELTSCLRKSLIYFADNNSMNFQWKIDEFKIFRKQKLRFMSIELDKYQQSNYIF